MGSGDDRGTTLLGRSILGLATGLLVALVLDLVPVLGVALILSATLYSAVALWRRELAQGAFVGGILIGACLVLAYGSVSTYIACRNTSDFCGNANVVPLAILSLIGLLVGVGTAVLVARGRGASAP